MGGDNGQAWGAAGFRGDAVATVSTAGPLLFMNTTVSRYPGDRHPGRQLGRSDGGSIGSGPGNGGSAGKARVQQRGRSCCVCPRPNLLAMAQRRLYSGASRRAATMSPKASPRVRPASSPAPGSPPVERPFHGRGLLPGSTTIASRVRRGGCRWLHWRRELRCGFHGWLPGCRHVDCRYYGRHGPNLLHRMTSALLYGYTRVAGSGTLATGGSVSNSTVDQADTDWSTFVGNQVTTPQAISNRGYFVHAPVPDGRRRDHLRHGRPRAHNGRRWGTEPPAMPETLSPEGTTGSPTTPATRATDQPVENPTDLSSKTRSSPPIAPIRARPSCPSR